MKNLLIVFLFLGFTGCVDSNVTQEEDQVSPPKRSSRESSLLEKTKKELTQTKAALALVQADLVKSQSALAEAKKALAVEPEKVLVATPEGEEAPSTEGESEGNSLLEETKKELTQTKATLAQVQAELSKTKEALAEAQKTSVTTPPRVLVAEEREREAQAGKERHEKALRKIVESELKKTKATLAQVQAELSKTKEALAEAQETLTEAQEALAEQEKKAQLEAEERKNTYIISANGGMFSVLATRPEAGSVIVSSHSALYFAEVRGPSCMKVKASDFPQVVAKIMIKTPQGEYSLCDGDCVPSHYYFNETGPKTKEHKDEWVGFEGEKKGRFEKYINIPLDENVMREVHIVREEEKIYEASSDDDFYVECERLYP